MDSHKLKFRKVTRGDYNVFLGDLCLGYVYYDADAWSYAPWFIGSEPQERARGGVNGSVIKARGFGTRAQAAHRLAVKMSSFIIAKLP